MFYEAVYEVLGYEAFLISGKQEILNLGCKIVDGYCVGESI